MRTHAPNWGSPRARALIDAGDVGGLIRWARTELGWRQVDLGKATGYSASAVSRLETAHRSATDLDMIRNFAQALFIPASALAAVLRVTPTSRTKVAANAGRHTEAEEDSMRRRSLLQAAGLAVPLTILNGLDDSLALLPSPTSAPTASNLLAQYRRVRNHFDIGDHKKLVLELPSLLAIAHACAEDGDAAAYAQLAACYDLATEALSKIGRYSVSRITADRSNIFSQLSGSSLAVASSARAFSIVLRHEGRAETAQRVTLHAAAKVEATGLNTPAQAAAFAQMLCTVAYAAAQAGNRDRALEMIGEAERAARLLSVKPGVPQAFGATPASVGLYKVGVLWGLGDAGAAVHAGKSLHPGQFFTAERRGRLHTDMARAWWQWGKPEETAIALLSAHQEAPAEVRDRPSIRSIVTGLAERHPRVSSVRQLAAAMHARTA